MTIRSEKRLTPKCTREIELAVTRYCCTNTHNETILHTDIFAVRRWAQRTHRIKDVVGADSAHVTLAECL